MTNGVSTSWEGRRVSSEVPSDTCMWVFFLKGRPNLSSVRLTLQEKQYFTYICSDVDPSRSPCLKTIDRKSFERGIFLVLRPVLLEIAYFNSGNRQLSIAVQPKELRQRKIVDPSRGAP